MFADDTCIVVPAMNVASLIQLCHEVFNAYSKCFASNILALNIKKTNYMIVGTMEKNECLLPFIKGVISRVSTVEYLGVILDDKLS